MQVFMEKKGREQQREETRERVYQAALCVFARDGFATCRIDDIAKEAKVVRGTFYFHFPTKDDVLQELLDRSQRGVAASLSLLSEDAPLRSVLAALCAALAAAWVESPKLFPEVAVVGLRMASTGPYHVSNTLREALAQRFVLAASRGELKQEVPAALLGDLFLIHLFAAMLAWSNSPGVPLEEMLRQMGNLFMQGAAARVTMPRGEILF
jgi:AcrR family transcriptional regulator